MPIRPTVHRELPASFYKLLLNPRSRHLPSRPRIYQYAHKYPRPQNGDTLNWPYPPFRLGSIPGSLYLSGYERVFMKKRRLGEYSANEAISPRPISTKCSWKAGKTRSPRRIAAAGRQGRQGRSRFRAGRNLRRSLRRRFLPPNDWHLLANTPRIQGTAAVLLNLAFRRCVECWSATGGSAVARTSRRCLALEIDRSPRSAPPFSD